MTPNAKQRQVVSDYLTALQSRQSAGVEIDWIALAHNIAEAVVNVPAPEAAPVWRMVPDGEGTYGAIHINKLDMACQPTTFYCMVAGDFYECSVQLPPLPQGGST